MASIAADYSRDLLITPITIRAANLNYRKDWGKDKMLPRGGGTGRIVLVKKLRWGEGAGYDAKQKFGKLYRG